MTDDEPRVAQGGFCVPPGVFQLTPKAVRLNGQMCAPAPPPIPTAPPSSPMPGAIYMNTQDGTIHSWTGAEWVVINDPGHDPDDEEPYLPGGVIGAGTHALSRATDPWGEGAAAARAGQRDADCPYAPASPEGKLWHHGWYETEGDRQISSGLMTARTDIQKQAAKADAQRDFQYQADPTDDILGPREWRPHYDERPTDPTAILEHEELAVAAERMNEAFARASQRIGQAMQGIGSSIGSWMEELYKGIVGKEPWHFNAGNAGTVRFAYYPWFKIKEPANECNWSILDDHISAPLPEPDKTLLGPRCDHLLTAPADQPGAEAFKMQHPRGGGMFGGFLRVRVPCADSDQLTAYARGLLPPAPQGGRGPQLPMRPTSGRPAALRGVRWGHGTRTHREPGRRGG